MKMTTRRPNQRTLPTAGDHGTQLDAYDTTGGSPPTERHQRRNFRAEHPDAYNEWRKQRDYCEEKTFYVRYDQNGGRTFIPKPKEETQASEDRHLKRYIAQVKAGTWPTERVQVTSDGQDDGLPSAIEVPKDQLAFRGTDVNSIERELDRMGASGVYEGGYPLHRTDQDLALRPIWEARKFAWAGKDGWRLAEYDPANAWTERMDRRATKITRIQQALAIRDEEKRLAKLDDLLDAFSPNGEDPGFASLLLEWVCDRFPDYQLQCLSKTERIHHRGRHPDEAIYSLRDAS